MYKTSSNQRRPMYGRAAPGGRSGGRSRLIMGLVMAGIAIFSFMSSRSYNDVTGQDQYISLTENQEIAMGLQAAPELIQQFGGMYPDQQLQDYVDEIGFYLVSNSLARNTDWGWEFHLLNDPNTVNAFALPGGQVFITTAMYQQLQTEGQLAGVLGHEIGHVLARHGAQRIAKQELTQGLTGAVVVASGDYNSAQYAAIIGNLINMKYGRNDELQSDQLGVLILAETGYDPHAMIGVMEILNAATASNRPPEFMSTHPDPGNRIQRIEAAILEVFPNGVPADLIP